jgi:hypothetical protein
MRSVEVPGTKASQQQHVDSQLHYSWNPWIRPQGCRRSEPLSAPGSELSEAVHLLKVLDFRSFQFRLRALLR